VEGIERGEMVEEMEEGGRDGESRVCDGNGGCDNDECVMVDGGRCGSNGAD